MDDQLRYVDVRGELVGEALVALTEPTIRRRGNVDDFSAGALWTVVMIRAREDTAPYV